MAAHIEGDGSAFRELFGRYAPMLLRILGRDFHPPDEVGDLVQQTFLQVHRARHDFRLDASFRPWVLTIALNLKRQELRRRRRRPPPVDSIAPDHPIAGQNGDPERHANARAVREALLRLPEAQRDAIQLHWFEGLTFGEIAHVLGVKESALKVRAHRGYARLREILGDAILADVTAETKPSYNEEVT